MIMLAAAVELAVEECSVIPSLLPSLPYVIVTDRDDDNFNDELILWYG